MEPCREDVARPMYGALLAAKNLLHTKQEQDVTGETGKVAPV